MRRNATRTWYAADVSKYFTDANYADRRFTNTRLLAGAAAILVKAIDDAFESVQHDVDSGGEGPLIFDYMAMPIWIVNHNLGRAVSIEVLNSGGAKIGAEVLNVSLNQSRVYFEVPVAGKVLVR